MQNNNISLENCQKSISKILNIVFLLDGKIFGGYLRDYLIPLEKKIKIFPTIETIIDNNYFKSIIIILKHILILMI